jgi:iron-sulfur cluster assembly accessory protein
MSSRNNMIHLTDAAITHLQKLVAKQQAQGFRLSVKASGCNGYRYHAEIIQAINPADIEVPTTQGLRVLVDATCVEMIRGTTIDYVTKGLGQSQLQFINPNVVGECGCGESFNIKEQIDG